ncbi:hypothetical protein B0H13DRAFT_1953621 [Mycena leptocephala]|nr:hypothetical protein B0H13DRAFT_1953621 [Mycena leptocephala]
MAVPLPEPNVNHFSQNVNLPPAPRDPPTTADIINAWKYAQSALIAEKENAAIDDHTLAAALVYEDSILCAASGGDAAPVWFGPAMQKALEPINKRLDDLEDKVDKRLDTLEGKIDAMGTKLDALSVSTAKNYNRTLRDGNVTPFVPVPFRNGTMPSDNDKTPTPLTSIAVIEGLGATELRDYCRGYYGNKRYAAGAPGQTERLADLCQAIGCTVEAKPAGAD